MGFKVNVSVTSATGIGGVYPFVVVCFDGDLSNELFKTPATTAGPTCVWNSTFVLDLKHEMKSHIAAGNAEPKYLTFFIFDTGTAGVPSLGSAGVLLTTVHEQGIAQGDFQVVNGSGTLALVVTSGKYVPEGEQQAWYQTNTAKVAAGTGVAALAAGIGAVALNQHKKKKKKKLAGDGELGATRELLDSDDEGEVQQGQASGVRAWWNKKSSSSSSSEEGNGDEEGHAAEAGQQEYQAYGGGEEVEVEEPEEAEEAEDAGDEE